MADISDIVHGTWVHDMSGTIAALSGLQSGISGSKIDGDGGHIRYLPSDVYGRSSFAD